MVVRERERVSACARLCVYFICSSDTDLVTSFVVFYFYTNLGKSTHKKQQTQWETACKMKQRKVRRAFYCVIDASCRVFCLHISLCIVCKFILSLFCYIRMLFTTYFDFYDFYSSLSHTHTQFVIVSVVFFP